MWLIAGAAFPKPPRLGFTGITLENREITITQITKSRPKRAKITHEITDLKVFSRV